MAVERVRQMSVEEFLDFAESSEDWYEYIDGELRLMTGGKLNHFRIAKNVLVSLDLQLSGSDCEVFAGGMLVKAGETRLLAPDVSVVCGEPETESDTRVLLNPAVVVEVTSPTSIDYDRGAKLEYYFDVPSIDACLVVDQNRALVELYRRSETGWYLQALGERDEEAPLESIECNLPLSEVYQSIDFESDVSTSGGD